MMGDRSPEGNSRVSAIYGTCFIISLILVGVVLFAGASTALTAQAGGSTDSLDHQPSIETVDGDQTPELELSTTTVEMAQGEPGQLATVSETTVPFEDELDVNDSIEVTGPEIEVEVLTAQIGDVSAPRKPLDVVLVPEQTFAMHTFWGTHYPSSHTLEFITQEQDVLTVDTGAVLNDKSFTAIGDWLGIGSVISGPYPYQCDLDEGGWFSDDEHWCGWKDTSSWYESSNPANAEMYHVNATKSLSFINGFDYDMDNWRYDMLVRAGGVDGHWVELETGSGDYYMEVDDYQSDEIYDNSDAAHLQGLDIPLDHLYYINYNFGSDTWGIDTDQSNSFVRMAYDGFLSEVDNAAPLDPWGERFKAMQAVVSILNGAAGDQVGIIANGEITNSMEDSFIDSDLDLDDMDNLDKILNHYEIFNSSDAQSQLDQAEEDIDDFEFDPEEYGEFNVWDIEHGAGGFETAISALPERDWSDKHIVLITGGQEPLRPQDEWYEIIGDAIFDALPDWGWLPDGFLDDRLTPEEAGAITDQHVIDAAKLANERGASVHTLGLGPSQDGFRLAAIADAADDDSNCLQDLSSDDCNYEPVTDPNRLADALLEQLLDETQLDYVVQRSPATLGVSIAGQEAIQLDLGNVNDPGEFMIEKPLGDEITTTFDDLTYLDDIEFHVEVSECDEYNYRGLQETFSITDTFDAVYRHEECIDVGDVLGTEGKNFVFHHGDDVEDLKYTQVTQWPENPAQYLLNHHADLIAPDGTLDLRDDIQETDGAIVVVPVDTNPKGYVMLHVEYDQLPDSTHFSVESVAVDGADRVAYEDADGFDTISHAVGEPLGVDYTVRNVGNGGSELITLETEDGDVVASKRHQIGQNQPPEHGRFEWAPGEADIGYHGTLVVRSQNAELASDVKVEVLPPGSSIHVDTVKPLDGAGDEIDGNQIFVDFTEEDPDDTPVVFRANITNRGPHVGTDEWLTIEVAEGVSMLSTETVDEIGAWGWNGTLAGGTPADNRSVSFDGWTPGYEIVTNWNEDGIGGVEIPVVVQTNDDVNTLTVEVHYRVDPAVAQSELEDLEDDDFDPIDIDVDEIEIDS